MNIPATLKLRMTFVVMLTAAGLFFGGFAHGYGLECSLGLGVGFADCEGE